jgi:hypothetical protein
MAAKRLPWLSRFLVHKSLINGSQVANSLSADTDFLLSCRALILLGLQRHPEDSGRH